MSGGGRPPNSAASLPLHSTSPIPLDSLQTPDTSSLFLSSLGSHATPHSTEFTSLEDILNFSGISHQPTSSSSSIVSSSPSLEAVARDLEQKGAAGPPEAKRLCIDVGNSPAVSTTVPAIRSSANILAASSTQSISTPPTATLPSATISTACPVTGSSATILTAASAVLVSPLPRTTATLTNSTGAPLSLRQTTCSPQPASGPLASGPLSAMAGHGTAAKLATRQSPVGVTLSPTPSRASNQSTSLPPTAVSTSLVVPSVLAHTTSSLTLTPLSSTAVMTGANSKMNAVVSAASQTAPLPPLPSNPAQRALLVQLVQAYKQCSALGDTQGQARVKAQLNLLLQAQQKMAVPAAPNHSNFLHTPAKTTPHVSALPTPITSTTSVSVPISLSPPLSSISAPATSSSLSSPSLLSSSSKEAEPVSIAASSLSTAAQGVKPAVMAGPSASPQDSSLSPLSSAQPRAMASSGPANAIKAAALYNLRLKQLQLFLQSLPEEQRPHSIPELKALLQRGGGPLGVLAQSVAATTMAAPTVPTLLCSTAGLTQPTVGQCLPQLAQPSPLPSISPAAAAAASLSSGLPALGSVSPASVTTGNRLSQTTPLVLAPALSQQQSTVALQPTTIPPQPTTLTSQPTTVALKPTTVALKTTTVSSQPTTITPQVTTIIPPGTTSQGTTLAVPMATTAVHLTTSIPDMNKPITTTSSSNEPIKPGVPTPLPPGVNPETLAVLCRMPDSDLQKLKLPPVLMTAIRVWRGQHGSSLQRGRKPASGTQGLPVIIPPSHPSSSPSPLPSTLPQVATLSQPAATVNQTASPTARTLSRPVTRHQARAEQTKAEKERLAALNKVLQSSEEARIAYRFNMLRDKMTNQLMSPDSHTPFKSLHDVIARLLPYHMWSEAEPPPGAIEKADAVYESVAQVLMSRSQGLMSNYQHLIYHDARRDSEAVMMVYLERLFQESERERREQEALQSQQAAQVAADLSLIAGALDGGGMQGPLSGLDFDAEFAFGDVMNADPMLTFEPGIT